MEAKDISLFYEEKQPCHSHMFDKKSLEVTNCLVQTKVTNVELSCYPLFSYKLYLESCTSLHIIWQASALQEIDMVLLHQTRLGKL